MLDVARWGVVGTVGQTRAHEHASVPSPSLALVGQGMASRPTARDWRGIGKEWLVGKGAGQRETISKAY